MDVANARTNVSRGTPMGRSLTIADLDAQTHDRLAAQAARHGRSPEDEAKAILDEQLSRTEAGDFWTAAERLREAIARRQTAPSETLQRESRDER